MMLLLTALALALPGQQQSVAAQDHAARIDRFLAALPPSSEAKAPKGETEQDVEEVKRLVAANPGKEAAIRAAIAARVACVDKVSDSFPLRALRKSAEKLSDAELDKLTEFYTGPDYARLLAAGDEADMKPLMERYPLARFMEATQQVMTDAPAQMFAEFDACGTTAQASLTAAGVKN